MNTDHSRPLLLAGAIATFLVALVHVAALFIGPAAFDYLDAAALARMMEQGSPLPVIATGGVTAVFIAGGLYGLSGARLIRPLPGLRPVLLATGAVFTLRGMGVIWFAWLTLSGSPDAIPREIGFSLVALVVGLLYLGGWRHLSPHPTPDSSPP